MEAGTDVPPSHKLRPMSRDALRAVLDGLEEPSCVSGTVRTAERVAIALPDGDVGAVDDARFVDWLLAHAELAPYGEGTQTKVDPKVRNAQRLIARDTAVVHGFDPASILGEIEASLSPGAHLSASLTDVIVYPKGGKFARHRDTPRSRNLIGTLVVGLPIAHTGGAFVIDDGRAEQRFDWGKPAATLPWVALFSDVDHWIEQVKTGARVTLVYALHRTDKPRSEAKWAATQTALRVACRSLVSGRDPLMIACGRHAIAEPGTAQPQAIDTLRGLDRELAEILVEEGYQVGVRACIAPVMNYEPHQPVERGAFPLVQNLWAVARLKAVPPASLIDALSEEGGWEIDDYRLDDVLLQEWIVRRSAVATLANENAEWAEPGNFGNEGYAAILYTLAAIEVTTTKKSAAKKPAAKKPAAKKPAKKPAAKKPAAKKPAAKKKR